MIATPFYLPETPAPTQTQIVQTTSPQPQPACESAARSFRPSLCRGRPGCALETTPGCASHAARASDCALPPSPAAPVAAAPLAPTPGRPPGAVGRTADRRPA